MGERLQSVRAGRRGVVSMRVAAGAVLAAAAVAALAAAAATDMRSASRLTCDRYVAPRGTDRGPGSSAKPFRTVARLVRSLRPGQTGCLRGVLVEDVTIRRGGRGQRARLTLRSDPRAGRATLRGRLFIADTANYVTVRGLVLDGLPARPTSVPLPSPTVNGDHAWFVDNEVTNANTGICFVLGSDVYGEARHTVIERNRIHHCGRLPPTNHEHGVYVAVARETLIRDNVIYANADRGVQLYPNAERTVVERNVIDGNGTGVLFAGSHGRTSSANVVRDNVITNSLVRYDVGYFWDGEVGTGNVAYGNCIWGGALGDIEGPYGFDEFDNLRVDPQYVDRAAGDFRLPPGSPCFGKGPR